MTAVPSNRSFAVNTLQYSRDTSYYTTPVPSNSGAGNNFGASGVQYGKDAPYNVPTAVAASGAGNNFAASAVAYGKDIEVITVNPDPAPPTIVPYYASYYTPAYIRTA